METLIYTARKLKGLRDSREPQERCADNIKKYFEEREKVRLRKAVKE